MEEGGFRGAPGKGRSRDRRTRRLRERTHVQISAAPSAKVKESARRSEPLRADGELMQRKQNYETVEGRCLIWRWPYCRAAGWGGPWERRVAAIFSVLGRGWPDDRAGLGKRAAGNLDGSDRRDKDKATTQKEDRRKRNKSEPSSRLGAIQDGTTGSLQDQLVLKAAEAAEERRQKKKEEKKRSKLSRPRKVPLFSEGRETWEQMNWYMWFYFHPAFSFPGKDRLNCDSLVHFQDLFSQVFIWELLGDLEGSATNIVQKCWSSASHAKSYPLVN